MNVRDLIAELFKMDLNAEVRMEGCCGRNENPVVAINKRGPYIELRWTEDTGEEGQPALRKMGASS